MEEGERDRGDDDDDDDNEDEDEEEDDEKTVWRLLLRNLSSLGFLIFPRRLFVSRELIAGLVPRG